MYNRLDVSLRVQAGLGECVTSANVASSSAVLGSAVVLAGHIARDVGLVRPDVVH